MKKLIAIFGLVALAACGGDDAGELETTEGDAATTTTTDVITEQDTTMAPVVAPVVTEDTGLVQTTTEVDVDMETDTVVEP